MTDQDERLLTTGEAAAALGIGHSTLLDLIRRGEVTPTSRTPGKRGHYRWDLDDLREQIRRNQAQ